MANVGGLTKSQGHMLVQPHLSTRRSTLSQSTTLFIGMDVHKDAIAVASVAQDHGAEVPYLGALGTRQGDLDHLVRKIHSKATLLIFVSEAGPWDSWLSRSLKEITALRESLSLDTGRPHKGLAKLLMHDSRPDPIPIPHAAVCSAGIGYDREPSAF